MSNPENTLDINLVELVNLAAKLLDNIFIRAPKDKSKPIFKAIKNGEKVPLGSVTLAQKVNASLSLAMDYTEFVGPGFNFDVCKTALQGILRQVSDQFKVKGDLNVMSSEEGTVLIHLPGAVEMSGQMNVMLLAFELGDINNIVFKLMFVDPTQYDAVRKSTAG